jgi:hypothetical protein
MRSVCLSRPCSWTAKKRLSKRASMILLMVLAAPLRASAENVQTDPFVFVQQYIRDIGATERLRAQAAQELADAGANPLAAAIHGGTRMSFELHSEAHELNEMRLLPPTENVPAQFAQLLEQKAELHEAMVDIAEKMMSGPQPGVDYGKLVATAPKLRAMLDETDETFFKATPLVFATLISETPDGQGHANRLVISKAARTMLIQDLEGEFGELLQAKNHNYVVEAASVLLGYLQNNGFKSSDERD